MNSKSITIFRVSGCRISHGSRAALRALENILLTLTGGQATGLFGASHHALQLEMARVTATAVGEDLRLSLAGSVRLEVVIPGAFVEGVTGSPALRRS